MSSAPHLTDLNPAQLKAVTCGEAGAGNGLRCGPLLIVAGAGTGKTHTLAHRVAHLVAGGVDPRRVLLLTFTRRAALEMRRRAREILKRAVARSGGPGSASLAQRLEWAGTFHSIANRLLREYAPHLRLDPRFTVMDRGDSADLLDAIRERRGLAATAERFPRKDTCLAIYSYRVNTQSSLKETLEERYPWCLAWEAELAALFREYVERKSRASLLDFDDLLLYWRAMMDSAQLARHVGSRFDHVLVDEYQDTNRLQGEILYRLKPDGAGLTVVGDDAQSIYSFRAATVENILGFADRFEPRAEVVTLARSYRSTQAILSAANALMYEAPRRLRKHLVSTRGVGEPPKLVTVEDLRTQADVVCDEILRRRESHVPLRRQAVLFRSGSHSDVLELELARRRIPFVKYGGLRFLEAAHVKDLVAILRWADNPRNTLAAFRVLQLLPGMGPSNARRAVELFEARGYDFRSLEAFAPPAPSAVEWHKLTQLMTTLGEPQRPWPGQTHLALEWYRPHLERLYEHVHSRSGDLEQLELLSSHHGSRERFLTELTLDPPEAASGPAGTPALDEDYLVLSTIHSAKGMEWDTVYLLNVVDGSFPSEFSTGRPELIEEERRLLYVAMTRAREALLLYAPLKFHLTSRSRKSDAHVYGGRSRFLTDKVLATLQVAAAGQPSPEDEIFQEGTQATPVDVAARLKAMW